MTGVDPLPQEVFFCQKSQQFVLRKVLSPANASHRSREQIESAAKALRDNPIEGVSRLYRLEERQGELSGLFGPLAGIPLDRLIQEFGRLPPGLWLTIAQQLLEISAGAHERGDIDLCFEPSKILVRREGDSIRVGFEGCEFHSGAEHEMREWAHWLRQLAIVWYFAATGDWSRITTASSPIHPIPIQSCKIAPRWSNFSAEFSPPTS